MAVQRKIADPAGITNASGQPEIVLEIGGLTLSMTPPSSTPVPSPEQVAAKVEIDADVETAAAEHL